MLRSLQQHAAALLRLVTLAWTLGTPANASAQTLRWYDVPSSTDTGVHIWEDASHWTTAVPPTTFTNPSSLIPGGVGAEARFELGDIPSAGLTVNLTSGVTVGQLALDLGGTGFPGGGGFVLGATGGSLTLDNGGSEALFTFNTGGAAGGFSSNISTDIHINGAAAILNISGGGYYFGNTPNITGNITGGPGSSLRFSNGNLRGDNTGFLGNLQLGVGPGETRANTESIGANLASRTITIEGFHLLSHTTNPTVMPNFTLATGATFRNGGNVTLDGQIQINSTGRIDSGGSTVSITGGIVEASLGSQIFLGNVTLSVRPSSYTGTTIVGSGAARRLTIDANEMVHNDSNLRLLSASTLQLNGVTENFNQLDMAGPATIDFGATGNSLLRFTDSSALDPTWIDTPLTLTNYVSGSDQVFVGTNNSGLTVDQLRQIRFEDGAIYRRAVYQPNGELLPGSQLLNEWITGNGQWETGGSWDVGFAPDSSIDVALFAGNVATGGAVVSTATSGTEYSLNELRFDATEPVHIDSSVRLRLNGNDSLLTIFPTNTAAHTISADIVAGTAVTIRQQSAAPLTLNGTVDAADASVAMVIEGTNSIVMNGTLASNQPTRFISKSGTGTLDINAASPAFQGKLSVGQGTLNLNVAQAIPQAELIVGGNSTAALHADQTINSLHSFDTLGVVDLGNHSLTIEGAALPGRSGGRYTGTISGSGSVSVRNQAVQTLSGANTYSGVTTVDNATLLVNNDQALGTTGGITRVLNNGVLQLQGERSIAEPIELAATLNTDTPFPQDQLIREASGSITLIGDGIISSRGGSPFRITGAIGDNGSPHRLTLQTTSVGTPLDGNFISFLDITNSNTFSGPANVTGFGIVRLSHANALGSTSQGTTVIGTGDPAADATLALGNDDTGVGIITFAAESLVLNGVGYGVPAIGYFGQLRTDWDVAGTGALRNMEGNNVWSGAIELGASSRIGVDDGTQLVLQQGVSESVGGAKDLTKALRGTLELQGASTYTGDSVVHSGVWRMAAGSSLSPLTNVIVNEADYSFSNTNHTYTPQPATFELASSAQTTVDGLSGGGIVQLGAGSLLSVGANNQNDTGAGGLSHFSGTIGGAGDLRKVGTGTQLLTGTTPNTFSGVARVSDGELQLGKQGALGGVSTVRVDGGTLKFVAADTPTQDRINDNADFEAVAGVLDTNGFGEFSSPGMGTFDLQGDFNIVLGTNNDAGNIVWFSDSTSQPWDPLATLTITNWNGIPGFGGGDDQILIGAALNSPGLSAAQLSQVIFDLTDPVLAAAAGLPPDVYAARFASGRRGEIVPVPEPSSAALWLLGLFVAAVARLRSLRWGKRAAVPITRGMQAKSMAVSTTALAMLAIWLCLTFNAISDAAIVIEPPDLNPGDSYRLAFVTSTTTDATSTDPNYYNNFVQSAANAIFPLQGISWKAIASTPGLTARDNTGTLPSVAGGTVGYPVYRLDGVRLAASNDELWDLNPAMLEAPLNLTETETTLTTFSPVWTATFADGNSAGGLGSGPTAFFGHAHENNAFGSWIASTVAPIANQYPLYAISEELIIVPEPSTLCIAMLGMAAWALRSGAARVQTTTGE